jgi:hypothetical protein
MKKISIQFILYGFLIWLIPFVISIFIFGLKEQYPLLFSKILTVILALVTAFFAHRVYSQKHSNFIFNSIVLGFFWVFLSIFCDLFAFLGMFNYTLERYFLEIPLVYLIIPVITILAEILKLSNKKEPSQILLNIEK